MKSSEIKRKARELGFDLAGIAKADPHADFPRYAEWIAQGRQGTMEWMVRGAEMRGDPQKVLPGAKSFICVGLNYFRGHPKSTGERPSDQAWISNYAWGEDYHDIVLAKLKELEFFILEQAPQAKLKSYVDTGPILERSYAASAGLGWIGKNTLLINRKVGSYFFLGEILTDLDLEADSPSPNHCGTCTRCLDACPTQALTPYALEARKCISYLTIEHKGEIPSHLKVKMGSHVYGCDICQDVCPWNKEPPISLEEAFDPRPGFLKPTFSFLKEIKAEDFSSVFKNSPLKRLKWERLRRNLER